MEDSKIRVVIVEDHPGVRAGIRRLLDAESDILVVGEGATGREAVQLARSWAPDILLLDIELPVLRGEAAMQHIRHQTPHVKVLVVSSYHEPGIIEMMLKYGARGYITKDEAPMLLVEAVRELAEAPGIWLSPLVRHNLRLS